MYRVGDTALEIYTINTRSENKLLTFCWRLQLNLRNGTYFITVAARLTFLFLHLKYTAYNYDSSYPCQMMYCITVYIPDTLREAGARSGLDDLFYITRIVILNK